MANPERKRSRSQGMVKVVTAKVVKNDYIAEMEHGEGWRRAGMAEVPR